MDDADHPGLDRRAFIRRAGGCLIGIAAGLAVPGALSAAPEDGGSTDWGYSGDMGPKYWGDLDPDWRVCSRGTRQSPINLPRARPSAVGVPTVSLDYRPASVAALDTGHSVEFIPGATNTIVVRGREFELVQFHEHTPSEHTFGGRRYPAELHFVHNDGHDNHVVLGVLLRRGAGGGPADELLGAIPAGLAERQTILNSFDVSRLFPRDGRAYNYDGSLTTPNCEQGVDWFVLRTPVPVSAEALEAITAPHPDNSRPVQPLYGRPIASARTRP